MELKFADEENNPKPTGGLRFSDESTVGNQVENELKLKGGGNQTENGLKLAGGESQTENSLKLAGEESLEQRENKVEKNPWDIEEPVVVSTATTMTGNSEYSKSSNNGTEIVLKITQIIIYVLTALVIASVAWITTQPLSMLYVNLEKAQGLFSILAFMIILDSVLINALWERKISLIIFALFLTFWYPKKRSEHMNGYGGMGTALSAAYVIALLVLFGVTCKSVSYYGAIVQKDDATRTEAVALMDQITEDGTTMGDIISDNMWIADAAVEEQNGQTIVALYGAGSMYIENDVFIQGTGKNIETQMAFIKNPSTGEYEIAAVMLNGTTLSEYGAVSYWNMLKEN